MYIWFFVAFFIAFMGAGIVLMKNGATNKWTLRTFGINLYKIGTGVFAVLFSLFMIFFQLLR